MAFCTVDAAHGRSGSEPGLIGLHSDRVMEEPEAGANRSFMIGERVVGDSDSRIEIGPGRILLEYIRDLTVAFVVEEVLNDIQPVKTLGRVGIKLPPHPEIDCQLRRHFPIVLHIRIDVGLAIIPKSGLAGIRNHSHRGQGFASQEIRKAGERPDYVFGNGIPAIVLKPGY